MPSERKKLVLAVIRNKTNYTALIVVAVMAVASLLFMAERRLKDWIDMLVHYHCLNPGIIKEVYPRNAGDIVCVGTGKWPLQGYSYHFGYVYDHRYVVHTHYGRVRIVTYARFVKRSKNIFVMVFPEGHQKKHEDVIECFRKKMKNDVRVDPKFDFLTNNCETFTLDAALKKNHRSGIATYQAEWMRNFRPYRKQINMFPDKFPLRFRKYLT